MKRMRLAEVKNAVQGELIQGDPEIIISGVSIDSRTIKTGELFIAIIGDRYDGHDFVRAAIKKGACALIVDREIEQNNTAVIRVDDTTKALQDLARNYRQSLKNLQVVAVTGSAGKTSTKDMIYTLLNMKFRVRKTPGNLNNYYGLPLSILNLDGDEEIAVLEMGMSRLGEIALLSTIARPEIGVITNVGLTHLESLGSKENVARGKSELISNLPEDGIAVLNYDDLSVRQMKDRFPGKKLIYYGLSEEADLVACNISPDRVSGSIVFDLVDRGKYIDRLILNKPGRHNIYNALAAIAVAREYNLEWSLIKSGLREIDFSSLRWEVKRIRGDITVINDTYNANPLSMKAAVDAAFELVGERIIMVLGPMLELGSEKERAHLELGRYIQERKTDFLITTGEEGRLIAEGAITAGMKKERVFHLIDNQAIYRLLKEIMRPLDTILVKGSRGVHMEEIVNLVIKQKEQ